jgi:uncharacterized protein YcgI (DUF1989 family)
MSFPQGPAVIEIPPQSGAAFELAAGQRLLVVDPAGGQVADFFCFARDDPGEWLSSGRSIDFNDTLFLTEGHALYSNRSEPMAFIREDTCGRHDFLLTPCSLEMFQRVAGNRDYHPSCHENLARRFAAFGIPADRIATTFNIFMNVEIAPDGGLTIRPPKSKAGDFVVLEACMDLIVGLTACSHEETNAFSLKAIRYAIQPPNK